MTRLIDADVLKKELAKNITIWAFNASYDGILAEIIDNAPTVSIDWGAVDGDRTVYVRPQGEWKLHGMIYYCSECGHECGESGDNFCGNCGAKMKGSAEE